MKLNPKNHYTFVLSTELTSSNDTKVLEVVARASDFVITRIRTSVIDKNGVDVAVAAANKDTVGADKFFIHLVDDHQAYHSDNPVPVQLFDCGGSDMNFYGRVLPENRTHKFKVSATPAAGTLHSNYPVTVSIVIDGYYMGSRG